MKIVKTRKETFVASEVEFKDGSFSFRSMKHGTKLFVPYLEVLSISPIFDAEAQS